MNIFVLDRCPVRAARCHCDKHVVKMIVKSAQLLSSAHHILDGFRPGLLTLTHPNHPCAIWTRTTVGNYNWLHEHFTALLAEYERRYKKVHAYQGPLRRLLWVPPKAIPEGPLTDFVQCMPKAYRIEGDPIEAYRIYYMREKHKFATWRAPSYAPTWWPNGIH